MHSICSIHTSRSGRLRRRARLLRTTASDDDVAVYEVNRVLLRPATGGNGGGRGPLLVLTMLGTPTKCSCLYKQAVYKLN